MRRKEGMGGWLKDGGLVQYFYGFFFNFKNFFISYFMFSASETPEGIFLLFMPRLFFLKKL